MSNPYIGEIRLFSYPRGAPSGWQMCDGSLLSIAQYETLYTLLGTVYGGDGQSTFGVPDLRGRVPIHKGSGIGLSPYALGQIGGTETVTLSSLQMASHFHLIVASQSAGTAASPADNLPATIANEAFYALPAAGITTYQFPAATIGVAGGNQAHANCAPTLALNYCISLGGIWPSQN